MSASVAAAVSADRYPQLCGIGGEIQNAHATHPLAHLPVVCARSMRRQHKRLLQPKPEIAVPGALELVAVTAQSAHHHHNHPHPHHPPLRTCLPGSRRRPPPR